MGKIWRKMNSDEKIDSLGDDLRDALDTINALKKTNAEMSKSSTKANLPWNCSCGALSKLNKV